MKFEKIRVEGDANPYKTKVMVGDMMILCTKISWTMEAGKFSHLELEVPEASFTVKMEQALSEVKIVRPE